MVFFRCDKIIIHDVATDIQFAIWTHAFLCIPHNDSFYCEILIIFSADCPECIGVFIIKGRGVLLLRFRPIKILRIDASSDVDFYRIV